MIIEDYSNILRFVPALLTRDNRVIQSVEMGDKEEGDGAAPLPTTTLGTEDSLDSECD